MKDIELDFDDDAAWFAHLDLHLGAALHEAAFDPAEHPRARSGKFASKGEPATGHAQDPTKGWQPSAATAQQAYGRTEDWEPRFANQIHSIDASLLDRTQSMIGQSRVGHYVDQLKRDPSSVPPIMVSWHPDTERYEVTDGSHRFEAAKQLGIKVMPAIVFHYETGENIKVPKE